MSKAQRKKEATSKQQVHNQTASSFSMVSHSDAIPEGNLEDSFNRQNSGNNLLDTSALGMGDNYAPQNSDGQGGNKVQFNMTDDQPLNTTVPTMTQS
jgi:hypothetical protein